MNWTCSTYRINADKVTATKRNVKRTLSWLHICEDNIKVDRNALVRGCVLDSCEPRLYIGMGSCEHIINLLFV
jgi:hypothetical protein